MTLLPSNRTPISSKWVSRLKLMMLEQLINVRGWASDKVILLSARS
jgi:hypothetical protein